MITEFDSRPLRRPSLRRQSRERSPRPAMTIIEVAVALVVLVAAMAALVQLVGLATRQRRAIHERAAALTEVANQAERLALLPWDEVVPGKLTTWKPSPELSTAIPRATCRAIVTEESEPPLTRRVELRVTWQNAAGQDVEPARLTIWKYRPEAQP